MTRNKFTRQVALWSTVTHVVLLLELILFSVALRQPEFIDALLAALPTIVAYVLSAFTWLLKDQGQDQRPRLGGEAMIAVGVLLGALTLLLLALPFGVRPWRLIEPEQLPRYVASIEVAFGVFIAVIAAELFGAKVADAGDK